MQHIMKGMAVFFSILCLSSMGAILYLADNKVITISDVAQDEVQGQKQDNAEDSASEDSASKGSDSENADLEGHVLTFVLGETDTSYLRIPLPDACGAESITIENHYMDKQLCIIVQGVQEEFYASNAISGNREMVKQGLYEKQDDAVKLTFQLEGIFEYQSILENNDLYISFLDPKEVYDKIVVIDPACGGANTGFTTEGLMEKDINLGVAKKLKEKLDNTDIKAYYTRMDDVNPREEDRVLLANEIRADMYICIQTDADKDSSVYGTTTVYNGNYFIPGFGSVELADALEREVVTSIKGKALGLFEAEDQEYVIRNMTVPAAAVKVGCITNKQEASLLAREEYQEKIAEGIYQAILTSYGMISD